MCWKVVNCAAWHTHSQIFKPNQVNTKRRTNLSACLRKTLCKNPTRPNMPVCMYSPTIIHPSATARSVSHHKEKEQKENKNTRDPSSHPFPSYPSSSTHPPVRVITTIFKKKPAQQNSWAPSAPSHSPSCAYYAKNPDSCPASYSHSHYRTIAS